MNTDQILGIYPNIDIIIQTIKHKFTHYPQSTDVLNILKSNGYSYNHPWFSTRNNRQIIFILNKGTRSEYLCIRPYEVHCQNYSEKRKLK